MRKNFICTEENKPEEIAEWLKKTVTTCMREIEKEVAKFIRRIDENTSSLNISLSDEERQQKKESAVQAATQTVEQQSVTEDSKEAESITETDGKENETVTGANPEEDKTESVTTGNVETEKAGRQSISAVIIHEVNRRDGGQCTYVSPDGRRCECNRF